MRVLLDTHVLIWALTAPRRLSKVAHRTISARSNDLFVSAVSGWEVATKHRLGKLPLGDAIVEGYEAHLLRLGAEELPITSRHALTAGTFPTEHRDPFDRLIAAQAIHEGLTLLSSDEAFEAFPLRVVW